MTILFNVERNERTIEVAVELSYIPAHRGYRDKYGAPEEPDEDACFEIESVTTKDGGDVDLTKDEESDVIAKAWEKYNDTDDEP